VRVPNMSSIIVHTASAANLNTDTSMRVKKECKITYRKLVLGILRPLDSLAFEAAPPIFRRTGSLSAELGAASVLSQTVKRVPCKYDLSPSVKCSRTAG